MSLRKAIKNGVVKILSPSYPVIISTRYFSDWNPSLFAEDNDIVATPSKSDLRKQIKASFEDLTLGVMLMDGDLGDNPTIDSVAPIMYSVRKRLQAMLTSSMSMDEKDFVLSRAYIRALTDFSKRSSKLLAFLKKNPQYLTYPKKPSEEKPKKDKKQKSSSDKKTDISSFSDKKIKKSLQKMIAEKMIEKKKTKAKSDAQYVALYVDSSTFSSAKARTEKTKRKANDNMKNLMTILKNN
jgi:hypothetical protein